MEQDKNTLSKFKKIKNIISIHTRKNLLLCVNLLPEIEISYFDRRKTEKNLYEQTLKNSNIFKKNDLKKINQIRREQGNLDAVSKHQYNDLNHICMSVKDGSPLFEPKTISKLKGYKTIEENEKNKENIIKQMEEFLNLSIEERAEYLNHYTEVRSITKSDCKKDKLNEVLIGQNGVFAKRQLNKFFLLGFYNGHLILNQDEKNEIIKKISAPNYGAYSFSFKDQKFPLVDGFKIGNRLTLINSPTTYENNLREIARNLVTKTNCRSIYARSNENPFEEHINNENHLDLVSYVTTRKIKKGEQLYIDYGRKYWKKKVSNYIETTDEDLMKAIKDFKVSKQKKKRKKYFR